MTLVASIVQIVIALGIVNVWIVRAGRATPYRPDGAGSLREEFRRYGLPDWARTAVGAAKLTLAALLVVGIWYPALAFGAGLGMALLMAGAVGAHLKVGDPIAKSLPALAMLVLSLFVAYANGIGL